ncbi:sulfatase [hydrothermal vent metagenome]|uniref:Sulfatase n=1 Tax=hydrothermal vent metagenome TaxID=652676 RepID=A0A1W1CUN7_9ZZZZ
MQARSSTFLIILTALFIVLFDNGSFFRHVIAVYPVNATYIPFLLSQVVVFSLFLVLFFSLLAWRIFIKPVLIFMLIVAAFENYFMQTYNVLIDETMIENVMQTDSHEVFDLMNWKLFIYFLVLGLLPAYFIYKTPLRYGSFSYELVQKIKVIVGSLILIIVVMLPFSKYYTSFFREHKILRYYTNPTHALFSLGVYVKAQFKDKNIPLKILGEDAKIKKHKRRKIIIMVVGEAARADHFSLNGYSKETNPLLKREDVISFSQMFSCGTTTAVSVPCMFSIYNRGDYSTQKGIHTENVLDVLKHAGVDVLWRDNNSDSKGVATRVAYQYYKNNHLNTRCKEGECRDIGMLIGLDSFINQSNKDVLIVLHQMGNHGPAYYKRYPKAYEKFTPACKTNQLEACTREEIENAYDNALLYTDYFLSQTIDFLKKYESKNDTAMLYMADHGESLGEGGLYLHGIPYFIAPEHQKHVGSIVWIGKTFAAKREKIEKNANKDWSQDNLFSTLLGLFNVESKVYDKRMDFLR